MLGFYETLALICFIIAAVMIIGVIVYEVLKARKDKKHEDATMRWMHWGTPVKGYQPKHKKTKLYDWKKDAPNDFS